MKPKILLLIILSLFFTTHSLADGRGLVNKINSANAKFLELRAKIKHGPFDKIKSADLSDYTCQVYSQVNGKISKESGQDIFIEPTGKVIRQTSEYLNPRTLPGTYVDLRNSVFDTLFWQVSDPGENFCAYSAIKSGASFIIEYACRLNPYQAPGMSSINFLGLFALEYSECQNKNLMM